MVYNAPDLNNQFKANMGNWWEGLCLVGKGGGGGEEEGEVIEGSGIEKGKGKNPNNIERTNKSDEKMKENIVVVKLSDTSAD